MSSWIIPLIPEQTVALLGEPYNGFDVQNVGSLTDTSSTMIAYNDIVICRGSPINLNFIIYIKLNQHLPINTHK